MFLPFQGRRVTSLHLAKRQFWKFMSGKVLFCFLITWALDNPGW